MKSKEKFDICNSLFQSRELQICKDNFILTVARRGQVTMNNRKEVEQETELFRQSNTILYFTDGSCFAGKLGTGVVTYPNTPNMWKAVITYQLIEFARVFQGQMFGIERVVGGLSIKGSIGKNTFILTGNQAYLKAVQNVKSRQKREMECYEALNSLAFKRNRLL